LRAPAVDVAEIVASDRPVSALYVQVPVNLAEGHFADSPKVEIL